MSPTSNSNFSAGTFASSRSGAVRRAGQFLAALREDDVRSTSRISRERLRVHLVIQGEGRARRS